MRFSISFRFSAAGFFTGFAIRKIHGVKLNGREGRCKFSSDTLLIQTGKFLAPSTKFQTKPKTQIPNKYQNPKAKFKTAINNSNL